jgi:hypothetical protein
MPLRRNPTSLKDRSLKAVTLNFEMLCYGTKYVKGSKALAEYIHTEGYKDIEGPFTDWPSTMLQELLAALYRFQKIPTVWQNASATHRSFVVEIVRLP